MGWACEKSIQGPERPRLQQPSGADKMDKMKHVEKSREGVPIWDGDSSTFQEFEESCLVWEQSVAYHKRYLCGPKIIAELQGTARRFILGKKPDWVSHSGGVQQLMDHLRSSLGLPQLPEMTEHLTRFFKQGRRKRGENMNDYITRKTETYVRACQSLSRVMRSHGNPASRMQRSMASHSANQSTAWDWYTPSVSGGQPSDTGNDEQFHEAEEQPSEAGGGDPWASASGGNPDYDSWWTASGWSDGWHSWRWSSWDHGTDARESADVDLLPDMIQGWYLLCDAGLDTGERNMILASIKQDFSFHRVAQELRNQWSDEDLKRRDQSGRQSSWWIDDQPEIDDVYEDAMVTTDDLNEEGAALMIAAQEEAEQAMMALQQNRRTLREARDKQHQVRMSRKYFKTSFKSFKGSGKSQSHEKVTCLKCGGDHRTSNCPRPSTTATSAVAEHSAPFICYAEAGLADLETNHSAMASSETKAVHDPLKAPPTTSQVVQQGKAVLDGGATRTLGSVVALERVMEINQEKNGASGLASLNLTDRPVFGFGNSTTNQCVSTAAMKIEADGKEGHVNIHALDSGEGPILFSISSLRSLGEIIDFAEDLVVFRNLTDQKIIPLERSSTGHQLLPMTSDWYESAFRTAKPVPSLRAFV